MTGGFKVLRLTAVTLALIGAAALPACGGGGGGGGSGGPTYEIALLSLPPSGTRVNAPFDVWVEITDVATGLPAVPNPPLDITLGVGGGGGTLSGPVTQSINTSGWSFTGLSYDAVDSLTIRATSIRSAPSDSTPILFEVDIQSSPVDLGAVLPSDPIPTVDFTLIDGPGSPYPTGGSLDWSLVNLSSGTVFQSGSEPFGGTPTATVSLAPVLIEGSYELTGNLAGSANQAVVTLDISSLSIAFLTLPLAGTLVNVPFDVEIEIRDGVTGLPVAPNPPLDVTLEVGAGGGVLSGTVTQTISTAQHSFTGLSYDAVDSLTIRATSLRSAPSSSTAVPFEVTIQATPGDLGTVLPNDPIPTADFTLIDGLGAAYPSAGILDWTLVNLTTAAVEQSGTEPFGGAPTATVALSPIAVLDSYELRANLVGSTNQATVALEISSLAIAFLVLPPAGTLVNASFDVQIEISDGATGLPVAPNPPLDVTLEVGAGSGTLSGTLTQAVSTAQHTFTNLSYDAFDALTIRAVSTRSAPSSAAAVSFEVALQASPTDLGSILPLDPIPPANFTLLDGLGVPLTSTGDLDWSLVNLTTLLDEQTGTTPFGGTSTATVTLAPIAVLDSYELRANHVGSTNQATVALEISRLDIAFLMVPPAGTLVNDLFGVQIEVRDGVTGLPVAPNPPLDVTLEVGGGGGTLSGTATQTVSTAQHTFTNLSYDAFDALTIRAVSARSTPSSAAPIPFEVAIQSSTSDLGSIAPDDPIPAVDFTLLDGLGAPFSSTGNLDWSLVNLTTLLDEQTGTVPFGGTSMATVNLSPVSVEDSYELRANLAGSANQATVALQITSLILQNLPGPFVALRSVCVGQTYADDVVGVVSGALEWGLLSGSIPAGITLDGPTGVFSGTPTTPTNGEFTLWARTSPVDATPIRCALAVFSTAETEFVPGQSFVAPGPFTVVQTPIMNISFTSSFDGNLYTTNLNVYHPDLLSITSPLPLFVHHRGRGFNYLDYDDVLTRIAAWGFICVSVEDYQSFLQAGGPPADPFYDGNREEAGMESGSAFQEAAVDHMLQLAATPGDPFEGKIDETKTFVGGHSRGGGATHGSHVRGLDLKLTGVVYFMPYDLRWFFETIPPGQPPAYAIPDIQPRLPSLIITAEEDGDLSYPFGDQIIDRASGQATFMVVYGAIHNFLGDSNPPDSFSGYISRIEEQDIIVNHVVAFLKRWGELDLSLEGFLYGGEFAGSTVGGVSSLRNLAGSLLIEDFQGFDPTTNSLGGANNFTGGTRTETTVYPPIPGGALFSLQLQHNIMTFNALTATYSTEIPPGTDLSGKKRLQFRCGQTFPIGYDWLTLQVRVEDAAAETATVTLFDRFAPSTTYLPDWSGDQRSYDRFVEVQVKLSEFTTANPLLDPTTLTKVDLLFDFDSTPSAAQQIYIDDIRLE